MKELSSLKKLTSNLSLLYVEDDKDIAKSFQTYLKKFFPNIDYKENGLEGLECYKEKRHDIIITDIKMPKMDGLEMSRRIKELNQEQNILITSAYSESEHFLESIKIGVDGYIIKPIDYKDLNALLSKIAKKIQTFQEHKAYEKKLKKIAKKRFSENLKLKYEKVDNYEKTLYALIDIIENRDPYTGKHSQRVAFYSKLIAQELGFTKHECEEIYKAGILHDLGKIAIPDSILLKPSKLNMPEYILIQEHVNIGFHMLEQIPMFKEIASIINCHHERLDGSGYPQGLKGDEIPFKSNVMAVADSFDAMTTNRIYKGRKTVLEALDEIKSLSKIHFKEEIVEAAIKVLQNITLENNISQFPQTTLEEERFSYFYKDPLTEIFNERYLDFILSKNQFDKEYSNLNAIFLQNFSSLNKKYGWKKGNEFLITIVKKLQELFPEFIIFRIHGDDFILMHQENKTLDINLLKELEHYIEGIFKSISISFKNINLKEIQINSLENLEEII